MSSATLDSSPSRYLDRVCLVTGDVLTDEIQPEDLLVGSHRDDHVLDVYTRFLMSRLVEWTGQPEQITAGVKDLRRFGLKVVDRLSKAIGADSAEKLGNSLLGLRAREHYFRFRPPPHDSAKAESRVARAADRLAKAKHGGGLSVLLTGGTGFIGKEVIWQLAHQPDVAEVTVVIRPQTIRDRKSGEVVRVLSPADRGAALLRQLWLDDHPARDRFLFVAGDIEQPDLGIPEADRHRLATRVTHVIHSAASVAFDDPYEASFSANVRGSQNALSFSKGLLDGAGSRFVAHLAIETSYIHGRQAGDLAREDDIAFPRNFYNNYYELTKAMASIETDRFAVENDLPVVQLCPSIVVGEYRTGNNRGDMKVVNAPVNAFGRAEQALRSQEGSVADRSKARLIGQIACIFPGDESAELNLIPVDWVVRGIVSALTRPAAVGKRIHLATDRRITSQSMQTTVESELGVAVRLAEPTLHRNVTLPVLTKLLATARQERLAERLEKLGSIFGGYSEWGQPEHQVGNDVELLDMPDDRPDATLAMRMVCRHNRHVQEFGKVRDLDEVSRRERIWGRWLSDLEIAAGGAGSISALPAAAFQGILESAIDLTGFQRL